MIERIAIKIQERSLKPVEMHYYNVTRRLQIVSSRKQCLRPTLSNVLNKMLTAWAFNARANVFRNCRNFYSENRTATPNKGFLCKEEMEILVLVDITSFESYPYQL